MTPMLKYVIMPAMSGTMTGGRLARCFKSEGDRIKKGQVIAEIGSDKAVVELEAEEDGRIDTILVPEGKGATP